MKISWKVILCGVISNIAEAYEFLLYGVFAPVLTAYFFPPSDYSFLVVMAVFAGGFLARPLGAIFIGWLGDFAGRKKALLLSTFLMAIATMVMGSLPSYADYGLIVTVAIILCRFLQGFSVGGEYIGATIFVIEHSPSSRGGLVGSFVVMSSFLGALLAMGVAYIVTLPIFPDWGWRIAFWAASLVSLFGFYVRAKIMDSPEFLQYIKHRQKNDDRTLDLLKKYSIPILITLGIAAVNGCLGYTFFTYYNIYFQTVLDLPANLCLLYSSFGILLTLSLMPLFGHLGDKFGPEKLMFLAAIGIMVCSYPLFLLLPQLSSFAVMSALALFSIVSSGYIGPCNIVMARLFPVGIRYRGMAFAFNVGMLAFGGTGPMINTYLIETTQNISAPGFYLAFCGLLGFLSIVGVMYQQRKLPHILPNPQALGAQ